VAFREENKFVELGVRILFDVLNVVKLGVWIVFGV